MDLVTGTTRPDPHVQVVRGTPDDVELAALVAGLVAASAGGPGTSDAPDPLTAAARARWVASVRPATRTTGPDAWRWSLRG